MKMKFDPQFIEELKEFEMIICYVSGGRHSSSTARLLWKEGFENVILMHNVTYLEMAQSIKTIEKLIELTTYPLLNIHADLKGKTIWEVMEESLKKIPEVMKVIEEDKGRKQKKYNKHEFPCCKILKEDPGDNFLRYILPQMYENFIVLDSICPYEGTQRRIECAKVKKNRNVS